ncbi:nucleolar protein 9 isoform X3 [Camarhynchus parvulus]|uniref:nucleolar protein 9 isoform X3 n=1 Tax=Geospiza parvula TaxID=87175 RepID=UPI001237D12E|nr:nucleolar protein 9 isoform X3 [Camarhynchus parvulus]
MVVHAEPPPEPDMSRQWRQSEPRLDPDTAEYFRRALETLEEGLSEEELALFAPNVLGELSRCLPPAALHPAASRLLQQLLPRAPPETLAPFLLHLGGVSRHPRGSRVLQAALRGLLAALGEGRPLGEGLQGALRDLGGVLGRDLGGLARDPNGSFVLRALLGLLSGAAEPVPPPKGAEPKPKKEELKAKGAWSLPEGAELPASFRPLLEELAQGLEQQIPALLRPACASLCLQGALRALRRSQSPSCARFCRALIGCLSQDCPAHQQSPLLTSLQDPDRSRLLEAAMTVLDPPGLRELFRGHLRGHLRGVASHRVANHGLQRLLDHAPEDVVSEVLSELGPALGEPLARGHPGVLLALLGAALRHPRLQGEALRSLFQALRCWAPPHHPHCVTALAQLRPLEGGDSDKGAEPELLLHFRDPSPILAALRALPRPALRALARSGPGSRVWDAILASKTVPKTDKKRLLKRLKGHWAALATDRSGSRVLDAAWACSPLQQRVQIASELAPHLPRLLREPLGRGVARSLSLELFQRNRPQWEGLHKGRGLPL